MATGVQCWKSWGRVPKGKELSVPPNVVLDIHSDTHQFLSVVNENDTPSGSSSMVSQGLSHSTVYFHHPKHKGNDRDPSSAMQHEALRSMYGPRNHARSRT